MFKKILILDTYYPAFLDEFYLKNPKAKNLSYEKQRRVLQDSLFGTSDFYSKSLNILGFPSSEIIINNGSLQERWESEYGGGVRLNAPQKLADVFIRAWSFVADRIPLRGNLEILKKQIDYYKPDILYCQNVSYLDPLFLNSVKANVKLLVGQIASPLPPRVFLKPYDLIITSFPHFVKKLNGMGINAEYLKLSFESSIVKKIPRQKRIYDVTFVGGVSRAHTSGLKLLYKLAEEVNLDVWGYGKEELDHNSRLYKSHHGEAWGKDMYKIFLQSKITVNRHIDVAENYANNMRLFEATGCGAMLMTDAKRNLGDIFSVGREVVDYKSAGDLAAKIKYYLTNERERVKIAKAGQEKTLKEHNYLVRMEELIKILKKYA